MGIKKINNSMMTYKAFIALPNHPNQRDTAHHAKLSLTKHLSRKDYDPELARQVAAFYFSANPGLVIKADGHTRCLLMESGALPKIPSFDVEMYECDTEADALKLYLSFDPPGAMKTVKDMFSGILKHVCADHGISLTSSYLNSGDFKTALAIATGIKNLDDREVALATIPLWIPVVRMMDELDLPKSSRRKGWNHGTVAAALLSLHHWGRTPNRHNRSVMEFWRDLIDQKGTKNNGVMCPIQAAYEIMIVAPVTPQQKALGRDSGILCGRLLSCVVSFMNNGTYLKPPRSSARDQFRRRRQDWTP